MEVRAVVDCPSASDPEEGEWILPRLAAGLGRVLPCPDGGVPTPGARVMASTEVVEGRFDVGGLLPSGSEYIIPLHGSALSEGRQFRSEVLFPHMLIVAIAEWPDKGRLKL